MKYKSLFIGATLLFFTSCSNKTTLTYQPVLEEQSKKSIAVKLLDFKDSRHSKDLVGHFRNKYGIPSTKLIARNNVPKWVTQSLREELERAGFTVTGYGSDVDIVIYGDLYDLYCDTGGYYNGRIALKVKVKKEGKVIFKREYQATEDNGFVFYPNAKSGVRAIELNMQAINREIVDDLSRTVFF